MQSEARLDLEIDYEVPRVMAGDEMAEQSQVEKENMNRRGAEEGKESGEHSRAGSYYSSDMHQNDAKMLASGIEGEADEVSLGTQVKMKVKGVMIYILASGYCSHLA